MLIEVSKGHYEKCQNSLKSPLEADDLETIEIHGRLLVTPKTLAGQLFCSLLIKGYDP